VLSKHRVDGRRLERLAAFIHDATFGKLSRNIP
jgi:hypothetical protein